MNRYSIKKVGFLIIGFVFTLSISIWAQTPSETPPPPSAPPTVSIPEVKETILPNGLKVVVVQKRGIPLVNVSLLIRSGANSEDAKNAGLASLTASLLTKGSQYMSATEIAEQIDGLGASIGAGAGWNSSSISVNAMNTTLGKSLSIMSNAAIRPSFPQSEINLLKKQSLDGFNVSVKQPGALWSYVASQYTFKEHLSNGTPKTIGRIKRKSIVNFHRENYRPNNAVLIFTGDITENSAFGLAKLFFGGWSDLSKPAKVKNVSQPEERLTEAPKQIVRRMLVIDLPNSGQAAVGYAKQIGEGRIYCETEDTISNNCLTSTIYYPASVLNSILGGGYSARLNQEIRLKRGLSYGAGSGFSWRDWEANFRASAQTKNESAAHVAELLRLELDKLAKTSVSDKEMVPRKAVLTGGFGRGLQTNGGLSGRLRDLYLHNISTSELNQYMNKVNAVSEASVKEFARTKLWGGDVIIVGDSKMFMADLQKRFPNRTIEVIKASDVDLNNRSLRKGRRR